KSTTTRSWESSNNKAALTVWVSNTLTRWFITRRSPQSNRKSCRSRRIKRQFKANPRKSNQMIAHQISSRRNGVAGVVGVVALLLLGGLAPPATAGKIPAGFAERVADVNGAKLHYFIGGKGSPVVLLHGYAETGHMW